MPAKKSKQLHSIAKTERPQESPTASGAESPPLIQIEKKETKKDKPLKEIQKKKKEPKTPKESKKRDPTKPKRAKSSYNLFVKETSQQSRFQGMQVSERMKTLATEWKSLSDKSKWEVLAEQDKKRYELEMQNYVPKDEPSSSPKKKKGMKDPNKPPKTKTAYQIFVAEKSKESRFQKMSLPERSKILSEEWKSLSKSEKEPYKNQISN